MSDGWGYLVMWEFRVRSGCEEPFEEAYGRQGIWARLFRSEDYIGTELVRDLEHERRYITLDYWTSKHAYEEFRQANASGYRAIDEECEAFTENENKLGEFERVGR